MGGGGPTGARQPARSRGDRVGRHLILSRIGESGDVYRAFDPELNRRIALKVVGQRRWTDEERTRALREAQAMAKLAHPNLVKIYDVGPLGDEVFLTMELVDGVDLDRWLAQPGRLRSEVVRVVVQVARGLAAAHEAGIVHGALRAADILVDGSGRARVANCGGGRAAEGKDLRTADRRAFAELVRRALSGAGPAARPGEVALPRWVRRLLERERAGEFGSMAELAAELGRERRLGKWVALGAAALALAATGLSLVVAPDRGSAFCSGADAPLAGVWDGAIERKVGAAFAASGRGFARDTSARVAAELDAYAARWVAARTENCRATRVLRVQSEAELDLRAGCLDRRLDALAALRDALLRAAEEPVVVDRAVDAVEGLPALSTCSDLAALRSVVLPPQDPEVAARVRELTRRGDGVDALIATGQYKSALAAAEELVVDCRSAGYAPTLAEALRRLGNLADRAGQPRSEPSLREAALAAARGRDDELLARVAVDLMSSIAYTGGRYRDALALAGLVAALVEQAGGSPELRAARLDAVGNALFRLGQYQEAKPPLEQALAMREAVFGPEGSATMRSLTKLAHVVDELGDEAGALAMYQRALATMETKFGPNHPEVATASTNVGRALQELGRLDEAMAAQERALAIHTATLGADSARVAVVLNNLGSLANQREDWAHALDYCQRAVDTASRTMPAGHAFFSYALHCMGTALTELGRPAEALVVLERALEIRRGAPDPYKIASLQFAVARALFGAGRRSQARATAERAIASYLALGAARAKTVEQIRSWLRENY